MKNIQLQIGELHQYSDLVKKEIIKAEKNKQLLKSVQLVSNFFTTFVDISTEFEYMDVLEEDGEITALYKQWNEVIYIQEELENSLDFILPFIHYEVIFQEEVSSALNYYNTHNDLYISKFYEIRDSTSLYLKPSISIQKTENVNAQELIIPKVKLRINLINPLQEVL
ncbi:MAG: hypothetical protein WC516_05865 [Patescibacteria group bacterium]|jgi:hypothetical protein